MWLTGWAKRIKITADKDVVDSDLSHFPLTIRLGTAVGIGDVDVSCVFDELTSDANRKKIAVTKADGETQLKVEIEKWDDANEKAVLHCGITGDTLASSADTDYYLYYDSSHAANTSYVGDTNSEISEGVWDSNFKAVWHLAGSYDGTAGEIKDSTSNDFDAVSGGDPTQIDAKIGKGQDWDGNDYGTGPTSTDLNPTTALMVSFWIKSAADTGHIVEKDNESNYRREGWLFYLGAGKLALSAGLNSGYPHVYSNSDPGDDSWHHIVGTFAPNSLKVYFDGEYEAEETSGVPATLATTNRALTFCRRNNGFGPDRYYIGDSDEFRVSSSIRTAAWIKATYNSGNDSLLTYGSEETAGSPSSSPSSSPSVSPSASPSSSPSESTSPSVSPSTSESASESVSPSTSESVSESVSPSVSESASPSSSPSPGWEGYTRGDEANLPADDTGLETDYTDQDYLDVDTKNDVRVGQTATNEYAIHLFKDYAAGDSCLVEWEGQTNCLGSLSTIYLQIYNRETPAWETIDSNNTVEEDTDFVLTANVADLTNYKDASNVISCRVYQEDI